MDVQLRRSWQVLIMDGNKLRVLTEESFNSPSLHSLSSLSATNCRLGLMSDQSLARLTKLLSINLSNNNLTELSPQEKTSDRSVLRSAALIASFHSLPRTQRTPDKFPEFKCLFLHTRYQHHHHH